jgi:AhpD family alkylhydroperoxidase
MNQKHPSKGTAMPKPKLSDPVDASIVTPAVAELVAIAAAIGANCEPCFKYHYNQARKLGVACDEIVKTVELADRVKRAPAQNMLTLADKLLGSCLSTQTPVDPNPASCCSSKPSRPATRKTKGQ